jgi:hypothetical protein
MVLIQDFGAYLPIYLPTYMPTYVSNKYAHKSHTYLRTYIHTKYVFLEPLCELHAYKCGGVVHFICGFRPTSSYSGLRLPS